MYLFVLLSRFTFTATSSVNDILLIPGPDYQLPLNQGDNLNNNDHDERHSQRRRDNLAHMSE